MRVWLADIDVPGLAMSRSIGDDVSHKVGVVNIPEIIECVFLRNHRLIYSPYDSSHSPVQCHSRFFVNLCLYKPQ
jgi:hypothetical protein